MTYITALKRGGIVILLLLTGLIPGYSLGWRSSTAVVQDLQMHSVQLERQGRLLSNELAAKTAQIDFLNNQLKTASSKLATFLQSERQLNLEVNHAEPISIGTFRVALIRLAKSSVTLNVDGKQQEIAAGSAVSLSLTSNCRVEVESFDASSTTIDTSCSRSRP